jgi:hypothetical protein
MEPHGCNWPQSLANRLALVTAKTSEIRCQRLIEKFHGKEKVYGSIP